MLRTPLCDLLGIDVPILCAPFGPWDQVELAAAVCEAGGLGALGTAVADVPTLEAQWRALRERTDRPFAINHTIRPFDEDAFAATLRFRPAAISFHIGVFEELVERAHAEGILWIQQVVDRDQAERALAAGADVVVAQGGEAGGHGGWVGTMVLVPEVVDLAGATPVVAAGGIADGRGVAAALALGAQGALVGTRFLASEEMKVAAGWKRRIVEGQALDAVKVPHSERVLPPYNRPGGPADPRALRTPLIDRLGENPDSVDPATAGPELLAALREDRAHEYIPFAGQSVALVHDVLPAAQIVRELVEGAEAALATAARRVS
ncbi:MAG TPA: nitronate monooxygenase [Solirubrobacteraceae bacterium]|nr:nitronate monooxygenase [Solirubrobacteraceae bacterium]